jgi:hypothetical protein
LLTLTGGIPTFVVASLSNTFVFFCDWLIFIIRISIAIAVAISPIVFL